MGKRVECVACGMPKDLDKLPRREERVVIGQEPVTQITFGPCPNSDCEQTFAIYHRNAAGQVLAASEAKHDLKTGNILWPK